MTQSAFFMYTKAGEWLNRICDAVVTPSFNFLRLELPAYGFFVCAGGVAGLVMSFVLAVRLSIPLMPLFAAASSGIFIALMLAHLTREIAEVEIYTFYHYQIAVLAAAGVVLWICGQPLFRNLDVLALSLGLTQAIGRLGCFFAGCCHGRPAHIGVCYRREHASIGLPESLVEVRLFPIQLVESAWIGLTVCFGIGVLYTGAAPGSALAWYIVLYGSGRFFFEFLRLDTGYIPGKLSEAQTTSLALIVVVVSAELVGVLVTEPTHLVCTAVLVAVSISIRPFRKSGVPFSAYQLLELIEAIQKVEHGLLIESERISVVSTSRGVSISTGRIASSRGSFLHYCISGSAIDDRTAAALAKLIVLLRGKGTPTRTVKSANAFRVILSSADS